ncbi:MAG: O-acetyl-ADP-ribose deacetylase [Chloroflexi bacterium AL-W]|nr:O-acetyl-ADP-ribose deacetylase [Chloroflexi bacterium AL-N1]NOK71691.1 O-acetyl-ADP-ribose deacetylase [Chloroflexi bacterium AL-N10]NOK79032.1 O-acetyl-ADP-ribose deacetylase [Chloroflexi bacterium AL-N5]NOK86466.1 O-acetyl-ADP-ribose deacetylase [Chloroflexi bacterium AL-W]NOK93432.1 O-acetyl-ADP-ribose deacetylase [Chloroflexi bacterium AL-N15]
MTGSEVEVFESLTYNKLCLRERYHHIGHVGNSDNMQANTSPQKEKRYQRSRSTIELCQGNIVHQDVDAIVNAANSTLSGGDGVDGAIHQAAGPELLAECRTLGACPTGEARITKGYLLPATHVIHAVGPVYRARSQDADLFASAYQNSLLLASQRLLFLRLILAPTAIRLIRHYRLRYKPLLPILTNTKIVC